MRQLIHADTSERSSTWLSGLSALLAALAVVWLAVGTGCSQALPDDGGTDGQNAQLNADESNDEGSDEQSSDSGGPTCPDPQQQSDQACVQVVTTCTHEPTDTSCEYGSPCQVPDQLENDSDWSCQHSDSDSNESDSEAPTCPDPQQQESGQACVQVPATCTHEPSETSCGYATPCQVPDQLRDSDDWSCGTSSGPEAPTCPDPNKESGQACVQVITTCSHKPTGASCQYGTPCQVPDQLRDSDDWSCDH